MDDGRNAIASARPAFSVGGQDQPKLDSGLLRLACGETEAGLAHCEAEFGNWGDAQGTTGFLWFDRRTLDFGKDFVVKIGGATVFSGAYGVVDACHRFDLAQGLWTEFVVERPWIGNP